MKAIDKIRSLPKIDLHCHLDGSMTVESMQKILGREIDLGEVTAGDTCKNLAEYLDKFAIPIQCIQTAEGLETAAREFLLRTAQENTRYVEVRFAPLLSVSDDLGCRQVVEAVLKGLSEAREKCGTDYNVIVCAMRHHPKEDSLAMMKVCREFLGEGVCAADLAGDEAAFPMEDYMDLFAQAKKLEIPFTIHAGECGRAENVAKAVECGAARVGHGIALAGNRTIQKLCADKKTGIEMCPTSNLQTRAATKENYPLREFMEAGLRVTLNTDNRTVSNTDMTREMCFVQEQYGITTEELKKFYLHAVDAAFAEDAVKQRLLSFADQF